MNPEHVCTHPGTTSFYSRLLEPFRRSIGLRNGAYNILSIQALDIANNKNG